MTGTPPTRAGCGAPTSAVPCRGPALEERPSQLRPCRPLRGRRAQPDHGPRADRPPGRVPLATPGCTGGGARRRGHAAVPGAGPTGLPGPRPQGRVLAAHSPHHHQQEPHHHPHDGRGQAAVRECARRTTSGKTTSSPQPCGLACCVGTKALRPKGRAGEAGRDGLRAGEGLA